MSGTVAFILKGYPRLSESFIAQEIHGLEQAGLAIRLYSMRHPTDKRVHPVHKLIKAPVTYLPEYLHDEPLRVLGAFKRVRRLKGFASALSAFLADLPRDPSPNRFRRFGQAVVLTDELAEDVTHLHAHFIHTPAAVVRYASLMSGLDWTVSAHAKDIWTSKPWELRQKLDAARFAVTCTRAGRDTLAGHAGRPEDVHLVYHGLDLGRFSAGGTSRAPVDGSDENRPVKLLSVGRAVPKKGYDVLLEALSRLPNGRHWRLEHIGGGEELKRLAAKAEQLGLAGRIDWRGPRDQIEVLEAYRRADLFVLPALITSNGDRDGLPNVLMEAQSQGLACLSTAVSGIPELIGNEETGLLVAPGDVTALAAALDRMIADPPLRARLGEAGEQRVRRFFSHRDGIFTLLRLFRDHGARLRQVGE